MTSCVNIVTIHGLTEWADDAFRPTWATPSIEFAILPPTLRRGSPRSVSEKAIVRGAVSPTPHYAASPSGVGLPTNSNGVGPITGEMRQFPHT